jgi:ureidoacrylate peracid hydrolase
VLELDRQLGDAQVDTILPVSEAYAQLPRVAEAISLARDAGIAVIYTAVEWAGIDEVPLGLRQNRPRLLEEWNQSPNLARGCWGAQISDVVAPQPGDLVLTKTGFDCPGLGEIAGSLGAERVFVIGTTANNCVYAAALALLEGNLDVVAVEDCISSFNDEMKLPWLHNIARFLGSVVTFDDYQALVGRGRVR